MCVCVFQFLYFCYKFKCFRPICCFASHSKIECVKEIEMSVCSSAFKNQECYYCVISFLLLLVLPGNFVSFRSKYQQMLVVFCGKDKIRNRQTVSTLTQIRVHKIPSPLGHIENEFQAKDAYMPLIAGMCASLGLIMEYSIWPSEVRRRGFVFINNNFIKVSSEQPHAKHFEIAMQKYTFVRTISMKRKRASVSREYNCSHAAWFGSSSSGNATIKSHSQFQ